MATPPISFSSYHPTDLTQRPSLSRPGSSAIENPRSNAPPRSPGIVNPDAARLAKRPKQSQGADIFNTLDAIIKRYMIHNDLPYQEIVSDFKRENPRLFDWILKNFNEAMDLTMKHSARKNRYVNARVQEALYQLPLAAIDESPLPPQTIFALLRNMIQSEAGGPEDIPTELALLESDNFLEVDAIYHEIAKHSLKHLQEECVRYCAWDLKELQEILPYYLSHLYLLALEASSTMSYAHNLENDEDDEMTNLFAWTDLSSWSKILEAPCESWADVGDRIVQVAQEPLEDNPVLLEKQLSGYRNIHNSLCTLQRALHLLEEPYREQLTHLVDHAFHPDGVTMMFPSCHKDLAELLQRAALCKADFDCKDSINWIYSQCNAGIEKMRRLQPMPIKTDLQAQCDQFCSVFDRDIYDASSLLLKKLMGTLPQKKSCWPRDLKDAYEKAKRSVPNFSETRLLDNQFLYHLSENYLGMDPIDWMQKFIRSLSKNDLESLDTAMQEASNPELRPRILSDLLIEKLHFPSDFPSLKTWCQSRED